VLLELYCLEVEEEVFDLPILRVQAPLYRQGPGYNLVSECPAAGFSVDAVLAWVPLASTLCLGAGCFIKRLSPLDQHIRGICAWSASDPFVGKGLARCGWWRVSVASVTLVSGLCRSCRDAATFNKASVGGFCCLRWLEHPVVKASASF
jgi:hypothetical protein